KKKWNIWVDQGGAFDRFRIMMGSATMMLINANATWAQPTLPSNASVRVNKVNTVYFGNKSPYEEFGWEVELWGTTQPMPGRVLAIDASAKASWLTLDEIIDISASSFAKKVEQSEDKLSIKSEKNESPIIIPQSRTFRTPPISQDNKF